MHLIRPSGGSFVGAGLGEQLPFASGAATHNVRLPIKAGDLIGIDFPCSANDATSQYLSFQTLAGAQANAWNPALVDDGVPHAFNTTIFDVAFNLNADVEPDADGDGFIDGTEDACPSNAATQGTCPPISQKGSRKCLGRRVTLTGSKGADTLKGTPKADVIAGLGGKDTIRGRGGSDRICGGGGRDLLLGGKGRDKLLGGGAKDTLNGGQKADVCNGSGGRDSNSACEKGPDSA